ncbi:MAG: BrnT family toxin [Nostocales cyanobacterium]|nr:MAG: BrnT family toxin [Nostocales cyanobacterium]
MVKPRLLVVVYTMRNETIRIISARPATKWERQQYEEE